MSNREQTKALIEAAFADVRFPGDWCLSGSNEGDEPRLLTEEFKDKTDWRTLRPDFLDQAPAGFGSALSFFSDEAFRFYLPAYLIADIDGQLSKADPVFHLTNGLTTDTMQERVNPRRYGERTWFDVARYKYAVFDRAQAAAIVAYLRSVREVSEFRSNLIDQALANYWLQRCT